MLMYAYLAQRGNVTHDPPSIATSLIVGGVLIALGLVLLLFHGRYVRFWHRVIRPVDPGTKLWSLIAWSQAIGALALGAVTVMIGIGQL